MQADTLKELRKKRELLILARDEAIRRTADWQARRVAVVAALTGLNGVIQGTITGDDAIDALAAVTKVLR